MERTIGRPIDSIAKFEAKWNQTARQISAVQNQVVQINMAVLGLKQLTEPLTSEAAKMPAQPPCAPSVGPPHAPAVAGSRGPQAPSPQICQMQVNAESSVFTTWPTNMFPDRLKAKDTTMPKNIATRS